MGTSFKEGSVPVKTNLHRDLSHATGTSATANSSFPWSWHWEEEMLSQGWTFPGQLIQYAGLPWCFPTPAVACWPSLLDLLLLKTSLQLSRWWLLLLFLCSSCNVTQHCKNSFAKEPSLENLWLVQPMCKTTAWIQSRVYFIPLWISWRASWCLLRHHGQVKFCWCSLWCLYKNGSFSISVNFPLGVRLLTWHWTTGLIFFSHRNSQMHLMLDVNSKEITFRTGKKWEREKKPHPSEGDFSRTPSKSVMELSKMQVMDPRLRAKKGFFEDQSLLTAGLDL